MTDGLNKVRQNPPHQIGGSGAICFGKFVAKWAVMLRIASFKATEVRGKIAHGDEGFHPGGLITIRAHVMRGHDTEHREHQRSETGKYRTVQTSDHDVLLPMHHKSERQVICGKLAMAV